MSSPRLPELCRICLLEDARAKANFSDNTIIVTNSAGSAFSITTPDGRSVRQMSEYALTRHGPLLAAVLEFRNMHVERPYFCKPLACALRSGFALGYVIRDATWPTPSYAIAEGLAQLQPDGRLALSSEDGVAQVVLHSHHRRFAVCYPLLVGERPQEAQYEYVWQTQVFSVASHPSRWQPAVRAALFVAAELGHNVESSFAALGQLARIDTINPNSSRLSGLKAGDQSTDGNYRDTSSTCYGFSSAVAPAERRTVLPRADDCIRSSLTEQLRTDGWWGEPSLSLLPPEDVLTFEWTPDATYQFLPEEGEVEVWVHADESCMVSTRGGRFLEHFKDAESVGQMYAANCVPDTVWSRDKTYRYPLAALAVHALKVRSHNTTLREALAARAPTAYMDSSAAGAAPGILGVAADDLFAVVSTAVVEESSVPGFGQFTAYEDGRVRICFDDRTILHMSASQSHSKVVLPDGRAVVVTLTNPVGVEPYVDAAREFAYWAFKTPQERAGKIDLQTRVHAELVNSQRMAQMCEYTVKGTWPQDIAQAVMPINDTSMPCEGNNTRHSMIENLLNENARLLLRL
ncbi:hypothetical protein Vretimale_4900 [Volvox reticuliferus]|uniref:DUF4520 domain-containing protein n=1 Tax=Volvox reticuliferus TaxID=1737510 RepID=A0A8J4DBS8_9CHLO|nr:hypothetical protein Vretifemale_3529 [Volvox reticuliferus]GIL99779.1 hypothetical protein Vretimale_4900 [Volvox reticuliferus]